MKEMMCWNHSMEGLDWASHVCCTSSESVSWATWINTGLILLTCIFFFYTKTETERTESFKWKIFFAGSCYFVLFCAFLVYVHVAFLIYLQLDHTWGYRESFQLRVHNFKCSIFGLDSWTVKALPPLLNLKQIDTFAQFLGPVVSLNLVFRFTPLHRPSLMCPNVPPQSLFPLL